jgi:hypothetical protein
LDGCQDEYYQNDSLNSKQLYQEATIHKDTSLISKTQSAGSLTRFKS